MDNLYIRPLQMQDANVSWKWRNDPEVWKFTGNTPDKKITYEIELEWIQNVIKRTTEIRFAICIQDSGKYIGNVQLTDINGYDAQFHIFIGDKENWGKGYGTGATKLMVEYGLISLGLQSIYLDVKKENISAIKTYKKSGFTTVFDYNDYHRMAIYTTDSTKKKVSIFVMSYNHEKFIGEALEGILRQKTNFDYDIVLGDDFSKDKTRGIILEYAIINPAKFKLLFYPKNITASLNQLWVFKNCTGKYIAMCEGDDYWTDPNKLQKQVELLDTHPEYVGCFHNTEERYEEGNKASFLYCNFPFAQNVSFAELSCSNLIPTCSVLFRNKLFEEFPEWYYELKMGDWPLHLLNAQFGDFWYMPQVMAVHRLHVNSIWMLQDHQLNIKYVLDAYDRMIDGFANNDKYCNYLKSGKQSFLIANNEVQKIEIKKLSIGQRVKNRLRRLLKGNM